MWTRFASNLFIIHPYWCGIRLRQITEMYKMVTSAAVAAERVGPAFSVDGMLLARQKTRQAIQEISALIEPGMVEEDAVELAKKMLVNSGMELSRLFDPLDLIGRSA